MIEEGWMTPTHAVVGCISEEEIQFRGTNLLHRAASMHTL
jgi:hypothetical protein